jgi:hypothetical protein
VTQDGHDFQWLIPDDVEPQYVPAPTVEPVGGFMRIGQCQHGSTPAGHLRALIVLSVLGAVLATMLAMLVVQRSTIAGRPVQPGAASAPAWLSNRPFRDGLSPDLAPQCIAGGCRFRVASSHDLTAMRSLLGGRFVVRGMRVFDSFGELRGLAVYVYDDQADELIIDAVWVPAAPARWDGARAMPTGAARASRWVLHAADGVWVVQATSLTACGGGREWPELTALATHRIHAAQLNL